MERRTFFASGLGIAASAVAGSAVAQGPKPAARVAPEFVVEAVQMAAWSIRNGHNTPIAPGDTVSAEHEVETAADAALVMRVPEGSMIRLGQKTRLGIQRLEVNPVDGRIAVRADLKLFDGFFRFATSAVAKVVGQRQVNVTLRTATIGVRGTDFWTMTAVTHETTCLFEGKVELDTTDNGLITLDKPTAFYQRVFDKPAQPAGNATPEQLNKFVNLTELQPGRGVAVAGGQWRVIALATADSRSTIGLAGRLRAQGYPARMRASGPVGRERLEISITELASEQDAEAILKKIADVQGVVGSVARMA